MGSLISIVDFDTGGKDPKFYFAPEHGAHDNRAAIQREYVHLALIHKSHELAEHTTFFVQLRRLVERQMEGDLIFWYDHLDYKWCWNRDTAKGNQYDLKHSMIKHGYWKFNFEMASDRTLFALHFGEMIADVELPELPGYPKMAPGEYSSGW